MLCADEKRTGPKISNQSYRFAKLTFLTKNVDRTFEDNRFFLLFLYAFISAKCVWRKKSVTAYGLYVLAKALKSAITTLVISLLTA